MTIRTSYFGGFTRFEPADTDDVFGVVRYSKEFVVRLTDRNILAVRHQQTC